MSSKNTIEWQIALPITLLLGLLAYEWFLWNENTVAAARLLRFTLLFGSIPLFFQIIISFVRRSFGIDVIAIFAVASSFFLEEYLVGIIILLMLSTGELLERFAFRRAQKEITALMTKAPTLAHKKEDSLLRDIRAEEIVIGDILVVRPGEIIPVDGTILSGETTVDESSITGESVPVEKRFSMTVMSGSLNQFGSIEIRANASSQDSQYERIVKLIKEAQQNEAPFVRMADAYDAKFTAITIIFALSAWFLSGDPLRVLAVLVVATPCPLILATPIAFASGISRAAKRGIMIKNGGALEHLGNARSFVFDKTGTLTLGTPQMQYIDAYGFPANEILRIAGSLEQFSAHIIAHSVAKNAKEKNLPLTFPEHFDETLGKGVSGYVDQKHYFFGSLSFLESKGVFISKEMTLKHETLKDSGIMVVYLATPQGIVGDIHFVDIIRDETKQIFRSLIASGIKKIVMLTGDKERVASHIAKQVGIAEYKSECLPEDKIREIRKLKTSYAPVIMVGDGINDAPALIEASMGIAMGTRGSTAATDASDIVITVNTLERIIEAFHIGKRVLMIAKQSIFIGIGASIVLMLFAAIGFIPPVLGAILQEVIDVIAIANALRVHANTISFENASK